MAQFRGTLAGQKGQASRLGSKKSGLAVTCNGWTAGVTVYADHQEDTGLDHFMVYRTNGSAGGHGEVLIAEFTFDPNS